MKSFKDVLERLGGYRSVAAGMSRRPTTIQSWRDRDSIPPSEWLAVVEYARSLGADEITLTALAELAQSRTARREAA